MGRDRAKKATKMNVERAPCLRLRRPIAITCDHVLIFCDLLVPRAAAALSMAQRRLFSERAVTRDGIAALVQAGPRLSGNGFGECDGYHEMGDLRLAL
jgi:hypothetical protein